MVHRKLTILDTNNQKEKYAIISKLVGWSKAFDMQDPTLGVKSFIKIGVRPYTLYLYSSTTSRTERWFRSCQDQRSPPQTSEEGSESACLGNSAV